MNRRPSDHDLPDEIAASPRFLGFLFLRPAGLTGKRAWRGKPLTF
jgi:hypothetical protein